MVETVSSYFLSPHPVKGEGWLLADFLPNGLHARQ